MVEYPKLRYILCCVTALASCAIASNITPSGWNTICILSGTSVSHSKIAPWSPVAVTLRLETTTAWAAAGARNPMTKQVRIAAVLFLRNEPLVGGVTVGEFIEESYLYKG